MFDAIFSPEYLHNHVVVENVRDTGVITLCHYYDSLHDTSAGQMSCICGNTNYSSYEPLEARAFLNYLIVF